MEVLWIKLLLPDFPNIYVLMYSVYNYEFDGSDDFYLVFRMNVYSLH